mmetsp:Transcript_36552/g.83354  ORF Transcript_36552/g.83354 Transcript_36552/m.83354 type:complete len:302 (-) Transcript_36552:190-1095(-)
MAPLEVALRRLGEGLVVLNTHRHEPAAVRVSIRRALHPVRQSVPPDRGERRHDLRLHVRVAKVVLHGQVRYRLDVPRRGRRLDRGRDAEGVRLLAAVHGREVAREERVRGTAAQRRRRALRVGYDRRHRRRGASALLQCSAGGVVVPRRAPAAARLVEAAAATPAGRGLRPRGLALVLVALVARRPHKVRYGVLRLRLRRVAPALRGRAVDGPPHENAGGPRRRQWLAVLLLAAAAVVVAGAMESPPVHVEEVVVVVAALQRGEHQPSVAAPEIEEDITVRQCQKVERDGLGRLVSGVVGS